MTMLPSPAERLARALRDAKHKLELYRAQHSGEYVGGREFHGLMRDIDEALECVNCGTALPAGCGGIFAGDGPEHCAYATAPTAEHDASAQGEGVSEYDTRMAVVEFMRDVNAKVPFDLCAAFLVARLKKLANAAIAAAPTAGEGVKG